MNWLQISDYLTHDDRCVVPIGSTEQHAYLSISTDSILAGLIARDAAEPLGIPVFPCLPYGSTPLFLDFPGTVSLRLETLFAVMKDILDSLSRHGFKRILIVNGHGGNLPVEGFADEWRVNNPAVKVQFHSWYSAPRTWARVLEIDPLASHASWMENFPWTREHDLRQPVTQKLEMAARARI